MKHLKIYENNNTQWVVINISTNTPALNSIDLFNDEESAKNYFIYTVNEIATEDKYYDTENDYNEDKIYISNLKEAQDYIEDNGYVIEYMSIKSMGKFELPENIKIAANTNKYNL